jgi:hypothetical protein
VSYKGVPCAYCFKCNRVAFFVTLRLHEGDPGLHSIKCLGCQDETPGYDSAESAKADWKLMQEDFSRNKKAPSDELGAQDDKTTVKQTNK